jgi:hypothetical protein
VEWSGMERSNAELADDDNEDRRWVYVMAASVRLGVVVRAGKGGRAGWVYDCTRANKGSSSLEGGKGGAWPHRAPLSAAPALVDARGWSVGALATGPHLFHCA